MDNTALLIIDVQEAFNERVALGRARNNPDAEANIKRILQDFRRAGLPVFHIHHASTDTSSLFARPLEAEKAIVKKASYSFIGTPLETELRDAGADGEHHLAEDIHQMSLANLNGEFAKITDTKAVLTLIK